MTLSFTVSLTNLSANFTAEDCCFNKRGREGGRNRERERERERERGRERERERERERRGSDINSEKEDVCLRFAVAVS